MLLQLRVGNGEDFLPRNGRWNFNNKVLSYSFFFLKFNQIQYSWSHNITIMCQKLVQPVDIVRWAIVNFSARCDSRYLIQGLKKCATMKGIVSFSCYCLKSHFSGPTCVLLLFSFIDLRWSVSRVWRGSTHETPTSPRQGWEDVWNCEV